MKKTFVLTALTAWVVATAFAEDKPAAKPGAPPAQMEANYTKAIEGRAADILKVLALTAADKSAKVHAAVIGQYWALKAWHEENDAGLKAASKTRNTNAVAQIRASLKTIHDSFIAKLSENLTREQVAQVKDKMTYGKVQFTYAGYVGQYPNLSEENKNEILKLLQEAREEAMDGGSAAEKSAVFQRYKGKINNYLSQQGIHAEPHPHRAADAATNSAPSK